MDNNHTTYKGHPVYQKLMASGPKRILSLEGVGILGEVALGYLEEIEALLIARYNDPTIVLSDYFDLVGGTSTEATVATFIALGKPISEIKKIFLELGSELSYHPDLKNLTLGSDTFKTGLAIFANRTGSSNSFVIHNHPTNKNYEINKGINLIDLLKATSEGVISFDSKDMKINDNESAVFIYGEEGVSHNLPLMLFLMTTIKEYGYEWRTSKDHMLMISIGNEIHNSKPSLLEYCGYNVSRDKSKLDTHPDDKVLGMADANNKVSSNHFPSTFDFGVKKPMPQPISQEELKKIFSPVFKEIGRVYKKCKHVFAKRVESNLDISTITSDGIETNNTAVKGDFIVKNQTDTEEQYVLKKDNFEKRYEPLTKIQDGAWVEYSPKGQVIGVQLTEDLLEKLKLDKHFNLMASWGQPQYIAIGDFIVTPLHEDNFYRIGLKEFNVTYTLKTH